jgi:hypothetical protein
MILFGCLLAFTAALAPRLVLILAWIFSDRWDAVWGGDILMPLLGVIFLPYTTIMYLLAWSPSLAGGGGIEGWDWMWILLGLLLDIWKWSQMWQNRKEAAKQTEQYYPSGAPRLPTGTSASTDAAVSSGQVPPSTSPSAVDHDTAPTSTAPPPPADTGSDEADKT